MPAAHPSPIVVALVEALGSSVSTDAAALTHAQSDKSGHFSAGAPLAIVSARSTDEVQQTLRIASAHGTPVVTRGAGTGLAGGAIAGAGEIVLSTLEMNQLLEVNAADELAVVQPGIINAELNEQLAAHGLWFTPDPASRAISTVGGNIATNAGGLLCAKYGVTRDSVLGLKVVLADGRLLTLGRRSVKGITGFDLTALMVGSEGLLGVIVEATVRLRRLVPGVTPTIGAYFADVRTAAAASAAVTAAGIRPAIMELVDAASLAAISDLLGLPVRNAGAAYLLLQTDGAGAETEAAEVLAVLHAAGASEASMTTDAAEAEQLLAVRRAMHPAMERLGTTLIEDVSVPRSALPTMFDAIAQIEAKYGITIPTIAHAGDGNLHPNFVFEGPEVPDHIWQAADEMFQAAIALGGTLTGEHGIGTLKKRWLREELGDEQFALQQQIKQVFDPAGILNPGKVF